MAQEETTEQEVEQEVETTEQEIDYKAMYEAARADADKWKALSRKNEARAKAAQQDRSDNAEIAALQDKLAAMEQERDRAGWVNAAIKANGLSVDDAQLLTGATEDEINAQASLLASRISSAGKSKTFRDSGEQQRPPKSAKEQFADFMSQNFN